MESEDVVGTEKEYGIMGMTSDGVHIGEEDLRRVAELMATMNPRISRGRTPQFDNPMGARIYIDVTNNDIDGTSRACHRFEIATPECPDARTLALYDAATDAEALARFTVITAHPLAFGLPEANYHLIKSSTDWKGNWWGCHKNYRIARVVEEGDIFCYLAPFLITKPIWAGAGGIGPRQGATLDDAHGGIAPIFSPRALVIRVGMGSATTVSRAIISTSRTDELNSLDLPDWKRLQLIESDPLMFPQTVYVEAGVTILLLRLIASGRFPLSFPRFKIGQESVVRAFHEVVRDLTMRTAVEMADGRKFTALELQRQYAVLLTDYKSIVVRSDQDADVLRRFCTIIKTLGENPFALAHDCECWFKQKLFTGILARAGTDWERCGDARMSLRKGGNTNVRSYLLMLHHQTCGLDAWGLFPSLWSAGTLTRFFSSSKVEGARQTTPRSRAAYRVAVLRRARELGLESLVGGDNWKFLRFKGYERTVEFEKADPTSRGNDEHIAAAMRVLENLASSKAKLILSRGLDY